MLSSYHYIRKALLALHGRPDTLAGGPVTETRRKELQAAPHLVGLCEEIRREAKRAAREPVPELSYAFFRTFQSEGTRKEFEDPYFDRRGRLLALTLTFLLDDDSSCKDTLENLIWEICNEYSWAVPAHLDYTPVEEGHTLLPSPHMVDLFAAETAHALAEMLYLVGDRLDPWVNERVRLEVERRIFQPVFEGSRYFGWFAVTTNWSAVCAGAIGMAALLLVDDRERLAVMQDRILSAMDSFLAGYGEDGCCPEGLGYWNYGFGYYVYWAEMLYEYTGGRIDLLQPVKIKRIAEFPGAVTLASPACVNYSDCGSAYTPHTGLASRLCDRLGIAAPEMTSIPSFHADHCYRWPHQVRNLLWTRPGHLHAAVSTGTFYFPSTEWLVDKRQTAKGLFAFSAKGGHNNEPHNHNDLGHFLLHAAGETLLVDLGPGMYTRDYFGEGRYTYLHNASAGHSVPVINGRDQEAGERYRSEVISLVTSGNTVRFELDLTRAYGPEAGLEAFRRTFEWECGSAEASLTLTDQFDFSSQEIAGGRRVAEHFISFNLPAIGNGEVVWTGEKGTVSLGYDPLQLRGEVEELDVQMHNASWVKVYRVCLSGEQLPSGFACRMVFTCRTLG